MRQKIDIADVETATKIRAKYLRALENEEFGLLPGNTFVKTFLRTYAEYLGLDPQLLLEEYRAGYEPRAEGEMQPYSVAARQRPRERQRRTRASSGPPGPGAAVIVVVGVVLVIFAILGLTSGGGSGGSNGGGQQAKKKASTKKHAHRAKPAPPKVTSVRLVAVPTVATYLCVDRGRGTPTVYLGTTASRQVFHGKRIRVNAGNDSIHLSANGHHVKAAGTGQPIGYDFRAIHGKLSIKPIPSGLRPCQ